MGDLKVEGKVSEWCSKCKHCIAYDTIVTNGICKITTYSCEDPYDGMTRALDAEDDICCSMFEPTHDMSYDKMSRLEHELEMDKLRREIHQLKKEKVAHMKGIERLKGSNNDLKEAYNHLLKTFKKENESGSKIVEENVKLENEKTEGRYPWGSDEDKVIKYCANDVTIIAEQMAREKQKELEDKVEKYEKILIDILNETYEHPQLFEHNIHAYKLIPGHIKFLRNSFDTMCDKYDPVFEENTKLKEEIKDLKATIDRRDTQLSAMRFARSKDDKRWNDLNNKFCLPLCSKLYGTTKVNKTYEDILSDISDLKEKNENLTEAIERRDKWVDELKEEKKAKDDEIMRLQWRNDNQSKMIQDLKKERDEIDDKYGKLKFKFCDMLQEKGELEETNNRYYKDNERLAKKNRELQIRVNDLLFQEKLNKSAFGYDYEEENGKLRVENEQLRNMLKSQRNCSQSYYYSALKAEDKIEHIHEQAKKWKRKYKEAYDILQEFFGEHSNIMSISYDISGDLLTLKLLYNDSAYTKHNRLENARERMKKLD